MTSSSTTTTNTTNNGQLRFSKLLNHMNNNSSTSNSNSNATEAKSDDTSGGFNTVEKLAPDAIFFTKQRYKADTDPRKINVGIGAYRDDNGEPVVLKVVKQAELELAQEIGVSINHEYFPIGGSASFIRSSQELILGSTCQRLISGCVAGVQGISGTGSLRVLLAFVQANFPDAVLHISLPTWGNHKKLIHHARLTFKEYRYWNATKRGLVVADMIADLEANCKKGDVVLLHACAHNPTGVDPTEKEWAMIADCCIKLGVVPFFDCAYQGFATGDLARDAAAVRAFDARGVEMLIAQSYSKNLGLYNERIGCATVVCNNKLAAIACDTQLRAIVRPMYSNPPAHGARIVMKVLQSKETFAAWKLEMAEMSGRILSMRTALRGKLEALKTPGTWNHITDQIGMFCFTGLSPEQVAVMIDTHHIYLLSSGRVSMAGVTTKNVEYIANAMYDVITNKSYYK